MSKVKKQIFTETPKDGPKSGPAIKTTPQQNPDKPKK